MSKNIKKIFLLVSVFAVFVALFSCRNRGALNDKIPNYNLVVLNVPICEESKYGGVYIKKTIEEFNTLGFEYGDSLDITFSNGYELLDLPYYSGYFSRPGDPLLVAYPGYDYIDACICFGDTLWTVGKFKDGDTANIVLKEKGKYKGNQDFLNLKYTDNREDYDDDEIFANFRNVSVGNLKKDILYRGTSPIDNKHKRAKLVNDLMERANIKYDIDLSDRDIDMERHLKVDDFDLWYFKSLYDAGKVSISPMNMNYKSESFLKTFVKALTDMSKNEGPYYIHCVEGKDRTGFVLAVLEGFASATYEEITSDFMKSYYNFYGVHRDTHKERYEVIKKNTIDSMLRFIADSDPTAGNENIELKDLDWVNVMGRFLINNGMSQDDMNNLYDRLVDESKIK